jgi:hypothetical protein
MVSRLIRTGVIVRNRPLSSVLAAAALCWCAGQATIAADTPAGSPADAPAATPRNSYPTSARVEYVQDCIGRNGGNLADLYKCSCVIDRLADHLTYDEFVEASTFARNATLGGEGGGIFRDPARAKEQAKLYRTLEADAYKACGLKAPPAGR